MIEPLVAFAAFCAEVLIGPHLNVPLLPINENLIYLPCIEIASVSAVLAYVFIRYGDDGARR